jgi:hypothetical protein
MDKYNRFFTPTLYQMVRVDWLCIMTVMMIAVAVNWREVNWWTFLFMFWWIDLIGTAPGMYFHNKNKSAPAGSDVPRWCIVAYNSCHSFATVSIVTLIWYFVSGLEWAMLAMPIHLAADRCIFGNIYKSFGLKFEAEPNQAFQRFHMEFEQAQPSVSKAALLNG